MPIPKFENIELLREERHGRAAVVAAGREVFINVYVGPESRTLTVDNFDDANDAEAAANRYLDTGYA